MEKKYMDGVFINQVTVVDVEPIYGGTEWQSEKWKDDIGLNIKIEIGQNFQPVFYIGGRLKKDEFGEIKDPGSVRRVIQFFEAIDVTVDLDGQYKIVNKDSLRDCIGRHFLRLSYVSGKRDNGKLKYSDFQQVIPATSEKRELIDMFKSHLNNKWIKNYQPEVMESNSPGNDELADW